MSPRFRGVKPSDPAPCQVDTLAVEVVNDFGATLLFDEQDGSYDASVHAVTFVSYLPEPGSQVLIRYTPR